MTVIIIGTGASSADDATADLLRDRGLKIIRLDALSIIGFLLASRRIRAVLVHEDCLPSEWEVVRERMSRIAPETKVVVLARSEQRSAADVAALVTS